MKVKDLITQLKGFDPEREIVIFGMKAGYVFKPRFNFKECIIVSHEPNDIDVVELGDVDILDVSDKIKLEVLVADYQITKDETKLLEFLKSEDYEHASVGIMAYERV